MIADIYRDPPSLKGVPGMRLIALFLAPPLTALVSLLVHLGRGVAHRQAAPSSAGCLSARWPPCLPPRVGQVRLDSGAIAPPSTTS